MRIGKRLLAAVAAGVIFAVSVPWTVSAVEVGEKGIYGDLTYTVLEDGTVAITDCDETAVEVEIPAAIDGMTVTSIGWSAFGYCEALTSITIPDGVTKIDNYAFSGCTSLTDIMIPESVTSIGDYDVFSETPWLDARRAEDPLVIINNILIDGSTCEGEVEIPYGVTAIGDDIFRDCTSLTKMTIPESVTSIGEYAFSGCTSLTSITIPDSVTSIGDDAFWDCTSLSAITIPDSVTEIAWCTFFGCTNLMSVTIPNSVTSIGNSAFFGCTSLTSVTIPDSVTSIESSAFSGCTSLTSITIPDSVTSIGDDAFKDTPWLAAKQAENPLVVVNDILIDVSGCSGDVKIPEGVTSIEGGLFSDCTSLTSITIPSSVTSIGECAFDGCTSLTSATIQNGVTSIGYRAFSGCTSLTSCSIPTSVTMLGSSVFYDTPLISDQSGIIYVDNWVVECTDSDLTTLELPFGTKGICDYAFTDCYGLTDVVIPESVVAIGKGAFGDPNTYTGDDGTSGLHYLKHVEIQGNGLQYIAANAFAGDDRLIKIDLPDSVTYIGSEAFAYTSLVQIDLPESLDTICDSAFAGTNINAMMIPESVRMIESSNFYNLDSIVIPNTLESLSAYAFLNSRSGMFGMKGVSDIYFLGTEQEWNGIQITSYYSDEEDETPELVTNATIHFNCRIVTDGCITYCISDGEAIVYACDQTAESVFIPTEFEGCPVTTIGAGAFKLCENLEEIIIPDSVTTIGADAFDYCSSLKTFTVPAGVQLPEVTNADFDNDIYFTSNGVEDLFDGCDALTEVIVSENNPYYLSYDGVVYDKQTKELLFCPTTKKTIDFLPGVTAIQAGAMESCQMEKLVLPDTITCIREKAFIYCANLTEITLPDSIVEIGEFAFASCSNLTEILLPSGLTKIDNNTFGGCIGLTNIVIPDGVTEIEDEAFYNCQSLTSVTIPNSVTSIGYSVFKYQPDISSWSTKNLPNVTIYGYSGSEAESYSNANEIPFIDLGDLPETTTQTSTTTTTTTTTSIAKTDITTSSIITNPDALYGDANLDGRVDITDAVLLNKATAGAVKLSDQAADNADCNGNGELGNDDALILLKFLVHLVNTLPYTE